MFPICLWINLLGKPIASLALPHLNFGLGLGLPILLELGQLLEFRVGG
jgi:hypothetical protein